MTKTFYLEGGKNLIAQDINSKKKKVFDLLESCHFKLKMSPAMRKQSLLCIIILNCF